MSPSSRQGDHPPPERQILRVRGDRWVFDLRVVGLAIEGDWVLLHRSEADDFWSPPGGRLELGESSDEGVVREMREETGVEVRPERLLWVAEIYFRYREKHFHELGLYYLVALPEDSPIRDKEGGFTGDEGGLKLHFRWFRRGSLREIRLLPRFLVEGLRSIPEQTLHVVDREPDGY